MHPPITKRQQSLANEPRNRQQLTSERIAESIQLFNIPNSKELQDGSFMIIGEIQPKHTSTYLTKKTAFEAK